MANYNSFNVSFKNNSLKKNNTNIDLNTSNVKIGDYDIYNGVDYEEIDYNFSDSSKSTNEEEIDDMILVTDDYVEPIDRAASMTDDEVIEEMNNLLKSINKRIDELEPIVKDLRDKRDNAYFRATNTNPMVAGKDVEEYNKYCEELEPYEEELGALKNNAHQLELSIALYPYEKNLESEDYASFVENYDYALQNEERVLNENGQDIYDYLKYLGNDDHMSDFEIDSSSPDSSIADDSSSSSDDHEASVDNYSGYMFNDAIVDSYFEGLDRFALVEYMFQNDLNIEYLSDTYEKYKYMTEEQLMLYHYLYKNKGFDEAEAYLELLTDSINQAKGAEMAMEFISGLDLTDEGKLEDSLHNLFCVDGQGINDGISSFFQGIEQAFQNDRTLSADEYKKMIILQYLKDNSIYHDEVYEFGSAFGNMIPSMVASAIATLVLTPAGGATVGSVTLAASTVGEITGTTLMGISAYGNAKHQALVNGADTLAANLYGILVGSSEAALGYFLGGIPGLSKEAGFTLRSLLKEGAEEYLQEWIDAGLKSIILNEDIDWSKIPEDAMESFLMGFLMSGLLNGGQKVVEVTINGQVTELNVEEVLDYIEENPDSSIMEAIEVAQPSFFNFIKGNNSSQYIGSSRVSNNLYQMLSNNLCTPTQAVETVLSEQYYLNKNNNDLRYVARESLNYLKSMGYSEKDAANIVADAYTNILNKVGFDYYVDENGIRYNVLKGMNWNNQQFTMQEVNAQINSLPPEMKNLVKEVNFYDTFNPYDFYWESEYDMNDFYSQATGGQGTINFWMNDTYTLPTISHEIGHTYDTVYADVWGAETGRISTSRQWQDAMRSDYYYSGLNGVSEYARTSKSSLEDFADSISLYYTNPNALNAFPARKALLEKYLPKSSTIATDYQIAYNTMVNKYGVEIANKAFDEYIKYGNLNNFTRDNNVRNIMRKYKPEDVGNYVNYLKNYEMYNHYNAVKASFDLAFGALIRKYGAEQAVKQMQKFINTGDVNFVTRSENAREQLSTFDVEEYRNYLRQINNNSLDVSYLVMLG